MKKVLALAALLVAVSLTSSAATLTCANITLDQLLSGANVCEVTDKIFSNFTYNGGTVAASNVGVTVQSNGAVPAGATIKFTPLNGANWTTLSLSYSVTVDTTVCQFCQFVAVIDQIFTPPTPNPNSGTFVHTGGGGTVSLNGSSPATLSGQANLTGQGPVSTTYTLTGGTTLQGLSSSYSQVLTPEPMTMSLMGAGLLAVGLFGRRFRRQ